MADLGADRLLVGDWSRVLRENLRDVFGPVALVTVTAPGARWLPCRCCGEVPLYALEDEDEVAAWNETAPARWSDLLHRISVGLRREGHRPPICVARVAQRQRRGADHLHLVLVCRTAAHRAAIEAYVASYRRVHVRYGFGYIDDPFRVRRSSGAPEGRDMVFEDPGVVARYLAPYLLSEQFERYLRAPDRWFRPVWIAPGLQRRTGWYLSRCKWLRQAWLLSQGRYVSGGGGELLSRLESRYPSWWFVPDEREWVLRHSGWDGVYGSGVIAGEVSVPAGGSFPAA